MVSDHNGAAMTPPFPLGVLVTPVTLGFVERPDVVWISQDNAREQLMSELEGICLDQLAGEVGVGTRAATVFNDDGRVYRCEVEKKVEELLEVRYLDYGNLETKVREELLELPPRLAGRPALALRVVVDGVLGVADSVKNKARVEKKLMVENLEVVVREDGKMGSLLANFSVCGKRIKFSKTKEMSKPIVIEVPTSNTEETMENVEQTTENVEQSLPESREKANIVTICQLPSLNLPEDVCIPGSVVFVSPEGKVWFSPHWVKNELDGLMGDLDTLEVEGRLVNLPSHQVKEGTLCLARFSQDGALYRARVVSMAEVQDKKLVVQFFDFGDIEEVGVSDLFVCPSSVLHMGPAAEEIVPAWEAGKEMLEDVLMEVEQLVVRLERKEGTGCRLGRFFVEEEELLLDNKIKSVDVHEKEKLTVQEEDDVVIEFETIQSKQAPEVNIVSEPTAHKEISEVETTAIRLVKAVPIPPTVETSVFLAYVETVCKVWVIREDDEERVLAMMDKLRDMGADLRPASSVQVGCVYGAKFSEDCLLYRVTVTEKGEGKTVTVRFIDHGNCETKVEEELLEIPDSLALIPAAALLVEIRENLEVVDHQTNRDVVEEMLTGERVTVSEEGKFIVDGEMVCFEFKDGRIKEWLCEVRNMELEEEPEVIEVEEEGKSLVKDELECKVEEKQETVEISIKFESNINCGEEEIQTDSSLAEARGQPQIFKQECVPGISVRNGEESQEVFQTIVDENLNHLVSQLSSPPVVKPLSRSKRTPLPIYVPPGLRKKEELPSDIKAKVPLCPEQKVDQTDWRPGTEVVALWPGEEGVWRRAVVLWLDKEASKALVEPLSCYTAETVTSRVWVSLGNLRLAGLPAAALNMIEQELVGEADSPVQELVGEADSPVQESEAPQETSDETVDLVQDLLSYADTDQGSVNLQSLLDSSPEQASLVLTALLRSSQSPIELLTNPEGSRLVQTLISCLPPSHLQPLLDLAQAHLVPLSTNSSGCQVMLALLQATPHHQTSPITSQLLCPPTLLTLVQDKQGMEVAKACLSSLANSPDQLLSLSSLLMGHTSTLGCGPHSTFFMQRLVEVLASHTDWPAWALLIEDILANLPILAVSEFGTSLVQSVLLSCDLASLVRAVRWVQLNMETVVRSRPAVLAARVVVGRLVTGLEDTQDWACVLDILVKELLAVDSKTGQPLVLVASLDPAGHLLARDLVGRIDCLGVTRGKLLAVLGRAVGLLKEDKFGVQVLRALEGVI